MSDCGCFSFLVLLAIIVWLLLCEQTDMMERRKEWSEERQKMSAEMQQQSDDNEELKKRLIQLLRYIFKIKKLLFLPLWRNILELPTQDGKGMVRFLFTEFLTC